jgi:hypothetical protein
MALLAELRRAGLALRVEGDELAVTPRAALTDPLRAGIRAHKASIMRELVDEAQVARPAAIRDAITAAEPILSVFRQELLTGRRHLCGNCRRYTFGPDPAGTGLCALYGNGLMAFAMPFECDAFEPSATPYAPEFLPHRAPAQLASERAGGPEP